MQVNISDIRKSLNKAWLKSRPVRSHIEAFKDNIVNALNSIDESESEEFHKNLLSDFLKNTYYSPGHFINTRGRADLVIHTGKDSSTPVGVLFEVKKPGNRTEMPSKDDLNSKAFSELILYYLRERKNEKNISIKNLIITDLYEWYIFSSNDFEKHFFNNKTFLKNFEDFESGRLSSDTTDFFYKSIAEPFVKGSDAGIDVTYFNLRDFNEFIRNNDKPDDRKLIGLYKIFSPEHLLKLPFSNDSNTLDRSFYSELLHIIGLEETKEGGKKVIGRKKEEKRNRGSLIENTVNILKHEDCLAGVPKRSDFGITSDEQLYNVALELAITWINRILFIKLLESQLVKYNGGDRSFRFMNSDIIPDYDELNRLFFQVLAIREEERGEAVSLKYSRVPFLNSSLFEPSPIEHHTIRISSLEDNLKIPLPGNTVLKGEKGRKAAGEINTLQYLFEFLDAYDFSGEGSEEIQEENKTLINASVLGLIFEKINGYKDGSFFTPGFITMYMCHETINRAVVQKFNEIKGWKCETISDIYNKITDIREASLIVNSLKICDPAVGSGHFLVSALNEIIAIKSELGILAGKDGKRLKDYSVEVINDELVVTDPDGEFFEYNPKNRESQRVQETLFNEKKTIIENCLFGVDINPNSVKICRLRLWIELLKNAYYRQQVISDRHPTPLTPKGAQPATSNQQLETLPNIDINIKCGNSLISRYPLDADIKSALRSAKWNVDNYREAIMTYRNAPTKEVKRNMEELIEKIKGQFETEVAKNDKRFQKLNRLKGEMTALTDQGILFDKSKKEKEEWNRKVKKTTDEMQKLETEIEEIRSNKIYENAFEWRFEFPEVLNDDGDFVGFDVVIGNPPYIYRNFDFKGTRDFFREEYKSNEGNFDLYKFFIERILLIVKRCGYASYIVSNTFLSAHTFSKLRKLLILNFEINELYDLGLDVFEGVTVENIIFRIQRILKPENNLVTIKIDRRKEKNIINPENQYNIPLRNLYDREGTFNIYLNTTTDTLIEKIRRNSISLSEIAYCTVGINTGYIKDKLISKIRLDSTYHKVLNGKDIGIYAINWSGEWIKYDKEIVKESGSLGRTLPPEYIFTHEKILIQRTRRGLARKLICAYDDKNFYNLNRVSNVVVQNNSYSTKYIIGLLNSKLMDYYFNKVFNEYEIKPLHLSKLPIKVMDLKEQEKIILLVNKILFQKKSNPSADTSALEAEIDRLVYELYGLTEEEIKIVEGAKA